MYKCLALSSGEGAEEKNHRVSLSYYKGTGIYGFDCMQLIGEGIILLHSKNIRQVCNMIDGKIEFSNR